MQLNTILNLPDVKPPETYILLYSKDEKNNTIHIQEYYWDENEKCHVSCDSEFCLLFKNGQYYDSRYHESYGSCGSPDYWSELPTINNIMD